MCPVERRLHRAEWARLAWAVAAAAVVGGCAFQHYEARPLEPQRFVSAFEQRRLDMPALRDFLPACGLPRDPWPRSAWDAAELGCAASFFDPGLARVRAEVDAVRARERTAAQGPASGAGAEVEHHSERNRGGTPWSVGANLDVALEAPGKREARVEAARARTAAAVIELEHREGVLRRQVAEGLLSYAETRRRRDLLEARAELLTQAQAMLERRRDVGYAAPFELAVVSGERQRAELADGIAASAAEAARDALATGIGIPAAALEGAHLELDPYESLPPQLDEDDAALQARALTQGYELRRVLQDYAVAEAALKEAIAAQYPDFTFSPGYLFDQADRVWRLAAALVLPPGGRNAGAIEEARAGREVAARAVEALQARIVGEVRAAAASARAALRAAQQAERLLAAAEAQEGVARRRLELGEGDRLELVHARLAALDARLRRAELIGAAWRARLRLEAAVNAVPGGFDSRTAS